MNIEGINKGKLLAALYNKSRPLGLVFLHYNPDDMSEDEANEIIKSDGLYFDYLNGRVMKVDISGDDMRTDLYNRDNGINAAEKIIENLRLSDNSR